MSTETRFSAFGPNSGYIEELYQLFRVDPSLVGESWARYFAEQDGGAVSSALPTKSQNGHAAHSAAPGAGSHLLLSKVVALVDGFRTYGHLRAKTNPLQTGTAPLPNPAALDLSRYGFTDQDRSSTVPCFGFANLDSLPLSDLLARLEQAYAGSVGFEFEHLPSDEEREWLRHAAEIKFSSRSDLTPERRRKLLEHVLGAEVLEEELHRTYVGVTRFSLQGSESLMPLLDTIVETTADLATEEVIFGMAHRGRLNVLVNTVHKPLENIFREFEDKTLFASVGSGDVKYHMDYSSLHRTAGGKTVRVSLAPNPSHLEFVNPVVMGVARAKQDLLHGGNRGSIVPVLIHGDAAFIGQGIVPESLNLCRIPGHACGGTLHVIVNNQVGFTTNAEEGRSSIYCSDYGKAFGIPILHVNGEDVEAVAWVAKLAAEFRMKFGTDVIIDLIGYRRWGHNEGDDPSFTQPVLYKEIEQKEKISKIYSAALVQSGAMVQSEIDEFAASLKATVKAAVEATKQSPPPGPACSLHGKVRFADPDTRVSREVLDEVAQSLISYPKGFVPNPKLARLIEKRVDTLAAGEGIEWGFAEALAYGSLVHEGVKIRLVGQDALRGTFSQRHLGLTSFEDGKRFIPLQDLAQRLGHGGFEVVNSVLSENAVMGYEFGYSTVSRTGLTLWEGQFGDFVNGAQVIVDQFIMSSEQKWGQLSGLVLLLPHGYEGRGPEHSSARLERFLQSAADGNVTVCYPTSSAQYFHMLRCQAKSALQRPLIVMTPKSLLRLPAAMSKTSELTDGTFGSVLFDRFGDPASIDRVIFMSGKIYYDVMAGISAEELQGAQVVRVEQLYPFPEISFDRALADLDPKRILWVQEEPKNMGAWSYVQAKLLDRLGEEPEYVGRPESASTATGSGKFHTAEQKAIVESVRGWLKES